MALLSRIRLRVLQKYFYVPPLCREHRIPFCSPSHSIVFAWMLQMRVLLDAAYIKTSPNSIYKHNESKKKKKKRKKVSFYLDKIRLTPIVYIRLNSD